MTGQRALEAADLRARLATREPRLPTQPRRVVAEPGVPLDDRSREHLEHLRRQLEERVVEGAELYTAARGDEDRSTFGPLLHVGVYLDMHCVEAEEALRSYGVWCVGQGFDVHEVAAAGGLDAGWLRKQLGNS